MVDSTITDKPGNFIFLKGATPAPSFDSSLPDISNFKAPTMGPNDSGALGTGVDKIIDHINRNYFARSSFYRVRIFDINKQTKGTNGFTVEDALFNCSAISIPGVNIDFFQDKRHGLGTFTKFPNGKQFPELNMTFYESAQENERQYFINWMDQIYNRKSKRFGFYNDYVKTIMIELFTIQGYRVYTAKMLECFPTVVGQLDKAYAADGIPTFTVAIQFFDMEEEVFPLSGSKNTIPAPAGTAPTNSPLLSPLTPLTPAPVDSPIMGPLTPAPTFVDNSTMPDESLLSPPVFPPAPRPPLQAPDLRIWPLPPGKK